MFYTFPNWLSGFFFKIEDEYETMLLDVDETNPENVRFVDSNGITIGEKIRIRDKEYLVTNFQLYSNMNDLNTSDKFYFDLHIIVSEIKDI